MNAISRLTLSDFVLLLALAGYGASGTDGSSAFASSGEITVQEGPCRGLNAFITVDADNVDAFVPDQFTLKVSKDINDADGDGDTEEEMAALSLTVERCEKQIVGDTVAPEGKTFAHFSVAVCDPEGTNESDVINNELVNNYHVFAASTNPDEVKFFREQAGLTERTAVWVKDLVFDLDPVTGEFTFEAGPPAPSPFTVVGTLSEPSGAPLDIAGNFWAVVRKGIMQIPDDINGFRTGLASYRVDAEDGSDMDRMFGRKPREVENDPASFAFASATFGATARDPDTFTPGQGRDDCIR